jgi:hypothetical protein
LEFRVADALHTGGVVSAQDGRLDDAGLIACHGAGMDVRTGVLRGPGTTALVTGTADTAPMAVLVAAHHAVARRQVSEGVYRGATEIATRVSIGAAPASGSRIDVVWVKQNDATAGVLNADATTEWLVSKTEGTAGTSPTKPAIPTGALELGTVTVAAGATATNGAGVTITNTVRQTVARGARVPVRDQAERDALTAFPGMEVYRLDTGTIQVRNAANTAWVNTYDPTLTPTPFALLYGASTQPIGSGVYETLNLDQVQRQVNINTTPAGGRINPTVPGWYNCSGQVTFSGSNIGRRLAAIGKNGVVINQSQNRSDPETTNSIPVATSSIPVALNAGDYITVMGFQDSGAGLNFDRAASFVQASYLGPL